MYKIRFKLSPTDTSNIEIINSSHCKVYIALGCISQIFPEAGEGKIEDPF